jgi:hypothetical protein
VRRAILFPKAILRAEAALDAPLRKALGLKRASKHNPLLSEDGEIERTPAAHRRGERYFHIVGKPALGFSPPSPFRSFNAPPGPWRANGPDCSLANPKSLGCVGDDHLHLLAPLTSYAHVSCNSGVKRVL